MNEVVSLIDSISWKPGDVIKIERFRNRVSIFKNDVLVGETISSSDINIAIDEWFGSQINQ
jgi:hypothetical protein